MPLTLQAGIRITVFALLSIFGTTGCARWSRVVTTTSGRDAPARRMVDSSIVTARGAVGPELQRQFAAAELMAAEVTLLRDLRRMGNALDDVLNDAESLDGRTSTRLNSAAGHFKDMSTAFQAMTHELQPTIQAALPMGTDLK